MKKKIGLYLLALFALTLYFLSSSERFIAFYVDTISQDKAPSFIKWDRYRYGGLYGLTYLSQFRIEGGSSYRPEKPSVMEKKEGNVWIIGDSFLEQMFRKVPVDNLYNTEVKDFYWFDHLDKNPRTITFKKGEKNILIIEMAERFVRDRFTSDRLTQKIAHTYTLDSVVPAAINAKKITAWRIVPSTIEQNLETIFFGYSMCDGIKESKADFNYKFFKRIGPQVYFSQNQGRLFLEATIDPKLNTSSFKEISDVQIEKIIEGMNAVQKHYEEMGFSDVIYTIIPNPSTICVPQEYQYNSLLPRLQSSPNRKFKMLDLYQPMISNSDPCGLFFKSDSHWNVNGYLIWKNLVNESLKADYASTPQ